MISAIRCTLGPVFGLRGLWVVVVGGLRLTDGSFSFAPSLSLAEEVVRSPPRRVAQIYVWDEIRHSEGSFAGGF